MTQQFSSAMIAWHEQHGRKNLPWQIHNTPYHTWLSEIMLQQTQVKTVIPYYEKFVSTFPTVNELAVASLDEVLHLWTGLGYYTRARNLHKCANIICQEHQGVFPRRLEELEALPGIGRSTAGAILSLSMDIPAAILDGNVKRVLMRFYRIEGWSGESKVQKQLWKLADSLLPSENVKNYNQSLMDLGATVCKRSKPLCELCPLSPQCKAYLGNCQGAYPQRKVKKALPQKSCYMLILQRHDGSVFLEQRPPQGLWGGLWSFPEFEHRQALNQHCKKAGWKLKHCEELEQVKHTFSHFQLQIKPLLCHIEEEPAKISESSGLWYQAKQHTVGLATPVKKLLERVQS